MASKTRKRRIRLRASQNPLAGRIARLCRLVRLGRKLTEEQAAAQLGIVRGWYARVEMGLLLPTPALARRLRQWMIDGITFEGAPPPIGPSHSVKTAGWFKRIINFPPEDIKALREASDRLGMGQESIVLLAVRRFLANKIAFATIKEAVKEVEHARAAQCLKRSPELRDLLEAEVDLMVKAGAQMQQWTQVEEMRPDVERLAEINPNRLKVETSEPEFEDIE